MVYIEHNDIYTQVSDARIHVSRTTIYLEVKRDCLKVKRTIKRYTLNLGTPIEDLAITNDRNAYFRGIHAVAKEHDIWESIADSRNDGKAIVVIGE